MTKKQCDIYNLIKEDVLWLLRHYWVFYIWPAILYFQFLAWTAWPDVTEAAISIALMWATADALSRLYKYLSKWD